jgi:hypothetical protein
MGTHTLQQRKALQVDLENEVVSQRARSGVITPSLSEFTDRNG